MKRANSKFFTFIAAITTLAITTLTITAITTISPASALDNWNTTTTGIKVITDISSVSPTTPRKLNLTIQCINKNGNIDS